ncbi:MAG: hypothetical protein ACFFDF_19520, partial [Candidatus Odinarchaeota archaeon]
TTVLKEDCSQWVQELKEVDKKLDEGFLEPLRHDLTREALDYYSHLFEKFTIEAQLKNAHRYNGEFDIRSEYLFSKGVLELCYKALEHGFSCSNYESFIQQFFWCYGEEGLTSIEALGFSDFMVSNNELLQLIKKNEKWYDIDRDWAIYQEREKERYVYEIAKDFNLKDTNVSMIIKKVKGAVSYYKGKLFEDFVEEKLNQSGLFEKVVKEAGSGEADILAYTKDGEELYIYSLKNLRIRRNKYCIEQKEFRPELERALLQSLDYQVHLILLVLNNYSNQIFQFEINYQNPENINISQ